MTTKPPAPPIKITDDHAQVFAALYKFHRLDFSTLAHLVRHIGWQDSTLDEYLRQLKKQNYVHKFYGNKQAIYALLDRGLAHYLQRENEPIRRMTAPSHDDAERIRGHDVGLSKFLVARDQWMQSLPDAQVVCHRDIFNQSLIDKVRQDHRLHVSFHYSGQLHHCHVKPDYVATIAADGALSTPVTEYDASTETMRPSTFRTSPANIHGKLIAYAAMLEHRVFEKYLGLVNVEVEFVFQTAARRNNALALAKKVLPSPALATQFFFAVEPDCPITNPNAYNQMEWLNGMGEPVSQTPQRPAPQFLNV